MHKLHPECYTVLFRVITMRTNLPAGTADPRDPRFWDREDLTKQGNP